MRKSDGKVIWMNPAPNSARWLRPVFLIREVESDPELLNLVIPETDGITDHLRVVGINVVNHHGTLRLGVEIEIYDSMKDLKFQKILCGLGGAPCL